MKESASVSGLADVSLAGARQRSQVARQKWEESWIAEQRTVTAVVVGQSREGAVAINAAAARPTTADRDPASVIAASSSRQQPTTIPTPADAAAVVAQGTDFHTSRTGGAPATHVGVPEQVPVHARSQADGMKPTSTGGTLAPREGGKSFAFWRDGAALDLSMRLRDPDAGASIVAQLRQWLRGSGSHLRSVVVNGRIAWQEQQLRPPAPPAEGPAARDQSRPSPSRLDRHI